ncbi:hypothetical protein C8R44DRAFT_733329 [Mycena epipterygia]|nr:hypothetical protein C8R44DRAFT_733329 [Mycena epipterygia]
MSSKGRLIPTNLPPEDVVMDARGVKDGRYYCLPPFQGDRHRQIAVRGGGFPWHLVFQGHVVGTFNSWPEAKASLTGYPGSGNRGYHSEDECITTWQAMCVLGIHPHPVDPAFLTPPSPSASTFVNVSPRKSVKREGTPSGSGMRGSPVKREGKREGTPSGSTAGNAQVLADLKRYSSPILPKPSSPEKRAMDSKYLNFAIRGAGIISSSARRRRARLGLPDVKPGKTGWVHGTKLVFFQAHKEDFLASAEIKQTGAFYTRMGQLYLKKYGYNVDWNEDLDEDDDVASDVDEDEDIDSLSVEEGEARAQYFKTLRGKIGVWYNAQYGGSVEKATKAVSFKKLFDKSELEPAAPQKQRYLHYYSSKFYDERIKDRVVARWAAVSRRPNHPAMVTVRNAVTKEAWEGETAAFQQEVLAAMESEYQAAKETHERAVSGEMPKLPAEYNVALNNAIHYVQPFADAMRTRFGMNIAILMCGPVADRGGRIEVRSVHSGMSNGLVPRIWSDFDRAGFDGAQRSFIDFSHQCFTEAECRARSLKGWTEDSHVPETEDAAAATAQEDAMGANAEQPAVTVPQPLPLLDLPPFDPSLFDPRLFDPAGLQRSDLGGLIQMPRGDEEGEEEEEEDGVPTVAMGKALARELAKLPQHERVAYMKKLRQMSPEEVEAQSNLARDRRTLHYLNMGMDALDAFGMDSDEEDDDNAPILPPHRLPTPPRVSTPERGPTPPPREPTPAVPPREPTPAPPREQSPPPPKEPTPPPRVPTPPPPREPTPPPRVPTTSIDPLPRPRPRPAYGKGQKTGELLSERHAQVQVQGGGESVNDEGTIWGAEDTRKDWGGKEWAECVQRLIALERAWAFPNKGLLLAPNQEGTARPIEVPRFMQAARKWSLPVEISAIGPREVEESFAGHWWRWWEEVQPPTRVDEDGTCCGRVGRSGKDGREEWDLAAAAGHKEHQSLLAEWRLAVEDISGALAEALKGVASSVEGGKSAKGKNSARSGKGGTKRRVVPTSSAEKENEPARYASQLDWEIRLMTNCIPTNQETSSDSALSR